MHVTRRRVMASAMLAWAGPALAANPPIRIGAIDKDAVSWVAAQLLADIFKQAGLALEILPMPGPRTTKMSLAGELDGDLIRIQTYGQNYPVLVRVEPPFYRVSVRAFSMPGRNARISTRDDLQHYTLGAIRGMAYVYDLTETHPALTLAQNSEQMFRMLQAGRLDLVLDGSVAARASIEKLGLKDMVVSPELAGFELYLYLHIRRRDLAPRIGEAIRKLKASGELARLTTMYEATVNAANVENFREGYGQAARS